MKCQEVEKTAKRGAAQIVLFTKYYLDDEIKDEIGWACSAHGGRLEMRRKLLWKA
jgi:hypothetical protein